jgi:hypothetical protein
MVKMNTSPKKVDHSQPIPKQEDSPVKSKKSSPKTSQQSGKPSTPISIKEIIKDIPPSFSSPVQNFAPTNV